MNRQRVLLRREDAPEYARVLSPEDLNGLLDELDVYGPETIGFAIEVAPGFQDDLPEGWDVLRLTDYGDGEAFEGP